MIQGGITTSLLDLIRPWINCWPASVGRRVILTTIIGLEDKVANAPVD
jgi:hypothetical protein